MKNERYRLSEQEVGQRVWTIVHLFYRSLLAYREQYEGYETKVKEFARKRNTAREDLRLNSGDLAALLDFKKLERMRDGYLWDLKDLCHSVFRGQDQTDLLDRYVSDIFHQVSILKEAHYNVKTYAPFFEKVSRDEELKGILDEAHESFPKLTKHIHFLFQQAQARLEEHLPSFGDSTIFIRSLYLHQDDFVRDVYPGGLRGFYELMYPLGGVEGFYRVGLSFYRSGFLAEAKTAFAQALEAVRDEIQSGKLRPCTPRRRMLSSFLGSLQVKHQRLCAALAEVADASPAEAEAPSEDPTRQGYRTSVPVPGIPADPKAATVGGRPGASGKPAQGALAKGAVAQGTLAKGALVKGAPPADRLPGGRGPTAPTRAKPRGGSRRAAT